MAKAKKLKNVTVFELIGYIVSIGLALWGLTYLVLGAIAGFISSTDGLAVADATIKKLFGLGYFYWGLIIFLLGVAILLIFLCVYAKKNDRQIERETRRAARLAQIKESEANQVKDAEFVEKEVSEPAVEVEPEAK